MHNAYYDPIPVLAGKCIYPQSSTSQGLVPRVYIATANDRSTPYFSKQQIIQILANFCNGTLIAQIVRSKSKNVKKGGDQR